MTVSTTPEACSDPIRMLDGAFRQAIVAVAGEGGRDVDPLIRPSQRPEHGDFQANCAMSLARQLGRKPRDLAEAIVAAVDLGTLIEPLEIAGPGFINIRLRSEALGRMLESMVEGDLGVRRSSDSRPVVVDMCSVNVAKQMHVGHLRSTIIGDALARVLERTGHVVRRENHLGDWGLPIAMVLRQLRRCGADLDTLTLEALDRAYRDAQLEAKADVSGLENARAFHAGPHRLAELEEQNAGAAEFVEASKQALVALQQGDESLAADWHKLIDCTLSALYDALEVLNVELSAENNRGESFYREHLPDVVDALVRAEVAEEDDGALVVRFEDRERPMLVRKSDGGFLYATTDLAAIRHRVHDEAAGRVIYVVDARQRDHFSDVFDGAARMGWDRGPGGAAADLVHVPFGAVLGLDKKPLKTRSGDNVTLRSLLQEAVDRGTREVLDRAGEPGAPTHGLPDDELRAIGRAVGIGAVKYADLSNDLVRDYVFDFDRMISFEGHTGPYLQYAHARVCSIFARAAIEPESVATAPIEVAEPAEKQLALLLLRYGQVLDEVVASLEPHRLCSFLYDLARAYSSFFEHCPVLKAPSPGLRDSRLRLCDLVRRVLADGLGLLGIEAPRRM